MRSRRSSSKSKQLEDSVQTNESQQMSSTMGNQATLQTMGMGGASPQSAIPVGTDSPSGMTGAPDQAQKKGPMAKRKERKAQAAQQAAQQAEFDASHSKVVADFQGEKAAALAEAQANPDNEYLQHRANTLSGANETSALSIVNQQAHSQKFVHRNRPIQVQMMEQYGSVHYVGNGVGVVGDLGGEKDMDMDELHQYMEDTYMLYEGKRFGKGNRATDEDATEEEISQAYTRSVALTIREVGAVMEFTKSHSDVFYNPNFSAGKLIELSRAAAELNYKAQQLGDNMSQLLKLPDYHKLDPELKQQLFAAKIHIKAVMSLMSISGYFGRGTVAEGVDQVKTRFNLTLQDLNLDTIIAKLAARAGTVDNPIDGGLGD